MSIDNCRQQRKVILFAACVIAAIIGVERRTNAAEASVAVELDRASQAAANPVLLNSCADRLRRLEEATPAARESIRRAWLLKVDGSPSTGEETRRILAQAPSIDADAPLSAYVNAVGQLVGLADIDSQSAADDAAACVIVASCVNELLNRFDDVALRGCADRREVVELKAEMLSDVVRLHELAAQAESRLVAMAQMPEKLTGLSSVANEYEDLLLREFLALGPLVVEEARSDPGVAGLFDWFSVRAQRSSLFSQVMELDANAPLQQASVHAISARADPMLTPRVDGLPVYSFADGEALVPWPYSLARSMGLGTLDASYSIAFSVAGGAPTQPVTHLRPTLTFRIFFEIGTRPPITVLAKSYHVTLEPIAVPSLDERQKGDWTAALLVNEFNVGNTLVQLQADDSVARIERLVEEAAKRDPGRVTADDAIVTHIVRYLDQAVYPRDRHQLSIEESSVARRLASGLEPSEGGGRPSSVVDRVLKRIEGGEKGLEGWKRLREMDSTLPRDGEVDETSERLPTVQLLERHIQAYRDDLVLSFYQTLGQDQVTSIYPVLAGRLGDERVPASLMAASTIAAKTSVEAQVTDVVSKDFPIFSPLRAELQALESECARIFGQNFVQQTHSRSSPFSTWWPYWRATEIDNREAADFLLKAGGLQPPPGWNTDTLPRYDWLIDIGGLTEPHQLAKDHEVLYALISAYFDERSRSVIAALRLKQREAWGASHFSSH